MPGYVPVTEAQKKIMLDYIGVDNIDDLFNDIPAS